MSLATRNLRHVCRRQHAGTKRRFTLPRRGFTLLELLGVIAIITLLMTLSVITVGNLLDNARAKATNATIMKIDGLLQDRLEAFDRALDKEVTTTKIRRIKLGSTRLGGENGIVMPQTGLRGYFAANNVPIRDFDLNKLSELLLRKELFRTAFIEPDTDGNGVLDHRENSQFPYDNSKHDPATAGAELLYHIITQGSIFGSPPDSGIDFSAEEVADTDGDGLPEFVDSWGKPLRYYPWPTRAIKPATMSFPQGGFTVGPNRLLASLLFGGLPAGSGGPDGQPGFAGVDDDNNSVADDETEFGWPGSDDPDDLNADPDDAVGVMVNLINLSNAGFDVELMYHTPNTYSLPLIVSAGPDGVLGLYEPSDRTNYGHLAQPNDDGKPEDGNGNILLGDSALNDNITNRQQ